MSPIIYTIVLYFDSYIKFLQLMGFDSIFSLKKKYIFKKFNSYLNYISIQNKSHDLYKFTKLYKK